MSLVQIKMHLGIIKKGIFFSSFPAAVPQHKPFVSGKKIKNVNPVCAPVGYTTHPVGTTLSGDLFSGASCLESSTLQIAGTVTQFFLPDHTDDKVQCNQSEVFHVCTKRYDPGKLHSKPCGAPQNSNRWSEFGTFRKNHWKLSES